MAHRFPNQTRTLLPSDELLRNPHKGFTTFQRFRGDRLNEDWTMQTGWRMEQIPQGELFCGRYDDGHPDTSLAYFRIPWRRLEPERGRYDFTFLDFVLEEADRRGQKVMLRFPPHAARPGELELPEWMVDALHLPEREVGNKMSPDHPLFYESYGGFIRAVGAHIDGDSRVSAVDMSLISAWGEGHQIDMVLEKDWKGLVDAYMQSFTKTPISAQFNHPQSVLYANSYRPVGLRADCLGNMTWHMPNLYPRAFAQMNELWKRAPIAFEVCWIMKHWSDMGWDVDYIIEQSLQWHISTFNEKSARIPDFLVEKCQRWMKKMGYRFALRVIDFPADACPGDVLHLSVCVQNLGVAPIYHRYPLVFRLRGERGVCYDLPSDADITTWLPGDHMWEGSVTLPPDMAKGSYALEVGITDGDTLVRFANGAEVRDGFVVAAEGVVVQ
ncbi:MAG: DUF4832 domain-containing protein [Clostridia bacterium]|nr:DUF4832 domain-containing protein [Clostridia bacterium]